MDYHNFSLFSAKGWDQELCLGAFRLIMLYLDDLAQACGDIIA